MKNKGFTVAEVLITLSIVGLVAALTLPSITTNITSHRASAGLMNGINNLTQTTRFLMRQQKVRSLANIGIDGNGTLTYTNNSGNNSCIATNYLRCLDSAGLKLIQETPASYRNFAMSTVNLPANSIAFKSNDGVHFITLGDETINSVSVSRYLLDVNGRRGPNVIGKDAFVVGVTRTGEIIPFGGRAWQARFGRNVLWQTECANNAVPSADASSCTGAIVDNGAQVRYRINSVTATATTTANNSGNNNTGNNNNGGRSNPNADVPAVNEIAGDEPGDIDIDVEGLLSAYQPMNGNMSEMENIMSQQMLSLCEQGGSGGSCGNLKEAYAALANGGDYQGKKGDEILQELKSLEDKVLLEALYKDPKGVDSFLTSLKDGYEYTRSQGKMSASDQENFIKDLDAMNDALGSLKAYGKPDPHIVDEKTNSVWEHLVDMRNKLRSIMGESVSE